MGSVVPVAIAMLPLKVVQLARPAASPLLWRVVVDETEQLSAIVLYQRPSLVTLVQLQSLTYDRANDCQSWHNVSDESHLRVLFNDCWM